MLDRSVMDVFSDILQLLRLRVDIYHHAVICGDWQVGTHELASTCFHWVTDGECQLDVPNVLETRLACGDVVVFATELPHRMFNTAHTGQPQQHLQYPEALGKGTGMLCGKVYFQHRISQTLLAVLPPVLVIRASDAEQWLAPLLQLFLQESLRPSGCSAVLVDRFSELLFTYALQHYLETQPETTSLFALYSHPQLSKAIKAVHRHPAQEWTVLHLARQAGVSRTVFSQVFRAVSGWSPMQYVTWWRLQLAWDALQQGASVVAAAQQVGYQSEAAFARVFQKNFGVTVGQVRRGHWQHQDAD